MYNSRLIVFIERLGPASFCVQLKTGTGILSELANDRTGRMVGLFGFTVDYTTIDGECNSLTPSCLRVVQHCQQLSTQQQCLVHM